MPLLDEVIEDIKSLKESYKNEAEQEILEKHSDDVEKALLEKLNEEFEEDPLADSEGDTEDLETIVPDNDPSEEDEAEDIELPLNLESLQSEIEDILGESLEGLEESEELEETEEIEEKCEDKLEEDDSIVEELENLASEIAEELEFEPEVVGTGMTNPKTTVTSTEDQLIDDTKVSVEIFNKLEEEVEYFKKLTEALKNKCRKLNTQNTIQKYKIKIFEDETLNNSQKQIMVGELSESSNIREAKMLYEALGKAVRVRTKNKPTPQSLKEQVNGKGSFLKLQERIQANTETNEKTNDKLKESWQEIAGITKQN